MFNFFKKGKNSSTENIVSPTDGQLIPITSVSDEMFARKIMGDGLAISPTNDDVFSPIIGTVVSIFPTKHALSLKTDSGIDILLHLGVDTVELKGKPFEVLVNENQHINPSTLLVKMDRAKIKESGKDDTIIMVFTNSQQINSLSQVDPKSVKQGELINTITLKNNP